MTRRASKRNRDEEETAEAIVDVLESSAIMGRFTVAGMEERVLLDARRLGRLMVDGASRDELEMGRLELGFATKLLVLADDRIATLAESQDAPG